MEAMVGNPREREQSRLKNLGPPKPPLGSSSSFQVFPNSSYVEVGGCSSFPSQSTNHNMLEKIPSTRTPVSDAGFVDSAAKPEMAVNFEADVMDAKKLRRIMSNRLSAQRSRLKKLKYLANLEIQAKVYERIWTRDVSDQIAKLEPQVANFESEKEFLITENDQLDHQMEALRKETLLKDAEIEKNKAEVNVLKEIQARQQEQLQLEAQMLNNWNNTLLDPVSNAPISNYYTNPYQGNEMEIPYMQMNNIAPVQNQMWMPAMSNMHQTNNLTLPNYMQLMEPNLMDEFVPNPNLNHHFA